MDLEEAARLASERINLRAQTRGMLGVDADKEKAAQAIKLQNQTGTDANTIYENHDTFVKDYKSTLIERIIGHDPAIREYVDNYPMGAKVSKDDWHNIAALNEKMDGFLQFFPPYRPAIKFAESFDTGSLTKWMDDVDANTWKGPLGAASYVAWGALGAPFVLLSRSFHAGLEGLNEALTEIGGPRFARDVTGATESYLQGTSGVHAPHVTYAGVVEATAELARRAEVKYVKDAFKAAKPFLKAGERPPLGTHPLWDEALAAEKKASMKAYDEVMDATKGAETKELSADAMAAIVETKNRGSVYVNSEAVHQLYGDKVPEPGDGLLGDIPGFVKQFEDSKTTGADIDVKWADWLARVPDETAKALRDDLRWRPGDLTLKEAEEIPKAKEVLPPPAEAPIPGASIWDEFLSRSPDYWSTRKFEPVPTPEPMPETPQQRGARLAAEYADRTETHGHIEFGKDKEQGNLLHALQQVAGDRVVPNEMAKAVRWATLHNRPDIVAQALEVTDKVNPALAARLRGDLESIRNNKDVMDSVKREMAQRPLFPTGWDVVHPTEWASMQELVDRGDWQRIGRTTVIMKPTAEWMAKEAEVIRSLQELLNRLAPGGRVEFMPTPELRQGEPPTPITGSYLMYTGRNPIISMILHGLSPTGTMRHEVLHHLRGYGFISREEWKVLSAASKRSWVSEHGIASKYPGAGAGVIVEEGVAAEYTRWAAARETTTPAGKIFQKIADFFTLLGARLKEIFGRDLTPDDIFTRVETGRVGRREPGKPLLEGAFDIREMAQKPEIEPVEKEVPTFAPGALMDKQRYAKYMRLINEINDKDVQKLYKDAIKEERKRQTPEWNKEAAKMYTEVREDIDGRRDFRVSDFFRNGKFGDSTLEARPKIDPKYLSAEEKAVIPSRFMSKGGFNPDELAGSFGYKTGRELIDDMVKFEKEKGEDLPGLYRDKVVAAEVERRMRMRFGDLDENIMGDAREHAIGLEQFDLLHEEYLQLGDRLGQQLPLTKQNLRDQAALRFNDTPQVQTALIKYTREIGRAGRDAEKAFLAGDIAGAFVHKQRQVELQALAEYAKRFERERASFERAAKRFNKREVAGIPPEYTNWIHDILFRVERPPRRFRADLDENIQRQTEKTYEEFIAKRNTIGLPEGFEEFEVDYNPAIPNLGPEFTKNIEAMTVGEFRAVNNAIQALIKYGRDEQTAMVAGEVSARKQLVGKLVDQLQTLREKKIEVPVGEAKGVQRARGWGRSMLAGLLQMEGIWDRIDGGKVGLFTKQFALPFSKAGNEFRLLQRDYSRKLRELNKYKTDLDAKIENSIFREPLADVPSDLKGGITEPSEFLSITRRHLRAIMLNVGNESNLKKLASGYGTTPEAVMDWVNRHATPEDWKFAQGVGKIFSDIQDLTDKMTMNMTNMTIEKLPLGQVQTAAGPIDGWYYPMIYDRTRGGGKRLNIDINPPPLIRAMTARGFERPRTGYAGPVWLTLEPIADHVGRRLRDIAFREIITETQKIFNDSRFTAAMTRNLGPQYTALLMPYLRDLAGMRGPTAANTAGLERFFEALRVNTIGTLIGWNPGTVFKHTPTAYLQSFKELDNPLSLVAATKDLFGTTMETMKANHKFMMEGDQIGDLDWKGSGELQGRRQHWYDTLGGATDEIILKPTFRHRVIEAGSWAIAQSDLAASKALWLAKYREVREKLEPIMKLEEAHTEAVDLADRAVRRTHGSTAVTSRPEFMRQQGAFPKYLTSLYGFFNHMFNRYYRMSWKTKELMKDVRAGEPVARDVWDLGTDFFFYVAVPGAIEEMVSGMVSGDDEGLGYKMFRVLSHPVFASVPVVRDIAHAAFTGHDPASGILTASSKAVTDTIRSLRKGTDFYNFGDQLLYINTLAGIATGLPGQQVGRWEKFLYNYFVTRMESVRDPTDAYRAFRYGTTREPRRH